MQTVRLVAAAASFALTAAVAGAAMAAPLISDFFTRVGPSETLVSSFEQPSTSTTNSYGGFVEIIVSGTGFSFGPAINDAFHGVPSGVPLDTQFYQLNIGWTGDPLVPFVGEPRNINNFIVFIEDVGAVTAPATPAYADSHVYHFVVDVPLAVADLLAFGVSDGNFSDNGGSYEIQVFQLLAREADVPVPASLLLTLTGLASLAIARRRS